MAVTYIYIYNRYKFVQYCTPRNRGADITVSQLPLKQLRYCYCHAVAMSAVRVRCATRILRWRASAWHLKYSHRALLLLRVPVLRNSFLVFYLVNSPNLPYLLNILYSISIYNPYVLIWQSLGNFPTDNNNITRWGRAGEARHVKARSVGTKESHFK